MRKLICLFSFLFLISFLMSAQKNLTKEAGSFLDEWHKDAANADMDAYFDKIDTAGIFIGTDATEVWLKQEFYDYSKPHFDKGKAWSFAVKERNIYFSEDLSYAWFDELLDSSSGTLRGSGVLKKEDKAWKIMHYVLSLPVPNEKFKEVINVLKQDKIQQ